MLLRDIIENVTKVWAKSGGGTSRKYRCTSGVRKGQVRSSPAACNAPLNIRKSQGLKKTKLAKGRAMNVKSARTKRTNPASVRVARLNKPRRPGGKKI